MRRTWAIVVLVLLGCRHDDGRRAGAATPPMPTVAYREGPASGQAQVFLVAGGDDVANFAAEIAEQRRVWRAAGLPERAIACYWAKPSPTGWRDDTDQYREVFEDVADCHRANPARLFADLDAAARRRPPFVYLYVTSHGIRSLLEMAEESSSPRIERLVGSLSPEERAALDAPAIGLQAGPTPRLEQFLALVRAWRSGRALRDLVLTANTLGDALSRFPTTTQKIVVLQACFSGAFIGHGATIGTTADARPTPLGTIPNLTVLTATAADQPSFGCDPGARLTYFGGAFLHALQHTLPDAPTDPSQVDWAQVHERASFAVTVMESIGGESPSRPGLLRTPVTPE